MLNLNKCTKLNLNQHLSLRTAQVCVHITVHNCRTQHSTEQIWWFSLSSSRQLS